MLPSLFFSVRLPTLLAMFWRSHIACGPRTAKRQNAGPPRTPQTRPVERKLPLSFIIFRLDSLGDVVMTTPLFRELKRAHPESHCTVVVQGAYKSLLVTNPQIDEVLTLPRIEPAWLPQGAKRLLSAALFYWTRLRKRSFDYAISPRWDVDEHLATWLCLLTNAAARVSYSEKTTPAKQRINCGFDGAFDLCLAPGPVQHETLRNVAIAEALGGRAAEARPEVRLTERDRRSAARLLANVSDSARLVAIGIGARSPGRRWPLERYAAAANLLARQQPIQTVILCSPGERAEAQRLARALDSAPISVIGAPLREVCAVLERCDLFLGNDSGCAHLAAAMNCRTIVISRHPRDGDPNHFNSPLRFAPRCVQSRVLQPASGLGGCKAACVVVEPHCITGVSVEEVVTAAHEMLREKPTIAAAPVTWPRFEKASLHLIHSHSAEAVRRAVEVLRPVPSSLSTPL